MLKPLRTGAQNIIPVSDTHLDVYKRQKWYNSHPTKRIGEGGIKSIIVDCEQRRSVIIVHSLTV